jgi:hypothetical protein
MSNTLWPAPVQCKIPHELEEGEGGEEGEGEEEEDGGGGED